jgi:methionyl aminopeptidase
MAIVIKTEKQIDTMRQSAEILMDVHDLVREHAGVGVTTIELDRMAEEFILSKSAKPTFKGYRGFKHATCLSINEEVIHGVPSKRRLREGDILSIDIGVYLNGYHTDMARTLPIGRVSSQDKRLIDVTRQCFFEGLRFIREGIRINDVSAAVQDYAEGNGYSVVRNYTGHGIGRKLHEDPEVPNFRAEGRGALLKSGMVICLEPMINIGVYDIEVLDDGWTVVTQDRKKSAHYENTILVTDGEPELLTYDRI